ncbi:hypothetical protein SDJN03_01537, partial [Cucurbita argyrosperma subsp. sororia]
MALFTGEGYYIEPGHYNYQIRIDDFQVICDMAEEKAAAGEGEKKDIVADVAGKKKSQGIFSRLWNGIFRVRGDDFEKRLQHISKEEAAVLARLKRRSLTWRRMARNLIIFSVIFEIIAVCYAIITTRAVDMNWKMRAFRVLPMFLLPALSTLAYTTFLSFTRMCDRKDQKTLERLRAERQAKIDELKEKTNYYITQQLIQMVFWGLKLNSGNDCCLFLYIC